MNSTLAGPDNRKFELTLSDDDGNTFAADLHSEKLFINGSDIGLGNNTCVIPIFKSNLIPSNQWTLGTVFL
jgi:hypothetical protein